jgi:type II restriction enzyme
VQYIADGTHVAKSRILEEWSKSSAIAKISSPDQRGWLTVILSLVDRVGKTRFSLPDIYAFEPLLAQLFPANKNIRAKIRQQLQVLRDLGQLKFLGSGTYMREGLRP